MSRETLNNDILKLMSKYKLKPSGCREIATTLKFDTFHILKYLQDDRSKDMELMYNFFLASFFLSQTFLCGDFDLHFYDRG